MVRQHFGRTALALLAVVALGATALSGDLVPTKAGGPKRVEAKVTATAEKPGADGLQKVIVVVQANPGWYAYANPVGNEEFADLATEIKVSAKAKIEKVQVSYPKGKAKKDDILKVTYNIYEGRVEIPVLVQRASGDTSPLEVSVRYNICSHKGQCLPIATDKFTLP